MASSADYLKDLTSLGYSFRYNEVTDRIEVNGEPITDVLQARIRAQMRDMRHKQMTAVEDAYTAAAWAGRYHPVRDYLSGLTWDGGGHIAALAAYFTDRHDVFGIYLRRFLIGACAKAHERTQNFMLVIDGPQGCGKSHFVNWLSPAPLEAYRAEGANNPGDKDSWLRLASKWLWEVGELGATIKFADREALKDFVSHFEVTVRRPYGRHDIVKSAMASFIGTTNGAATGLLNDPSGSRRFAITELTALDWGYITDIDVDQVWAEAYTASQAGEPWKLTAAERTRQEAINEGYEVELPLEGMLHKYYEIDPAGKGWTSGIDIITELETMGLKGLQHASLSELSRFMMRLGIERERVKRTWGYRGVTRKSPGVII